MYMRACERVHVCVVCVWMSWLCVKVRHADGLYFFSGSYDSIEMIAKHGVGKSMAQTYYWSPLLFNSLLLKPSWLPSKQYKPLVIQ